MRISLPCFIKMQLACTLILCSMWSVAHTLPLEVEEELVLVEQDDHLAYRQRRSPLAPPQRMRFKVNLSGTQVILRLALNRRITANPNVYLNINGTIQKVYTRTTGSTALYQEHTTGSAMLVKCGLLWSSCKLSGSFHVGNTSYLLRPNEDQPVQVENHYIKEVNYNEDSGFGDDYLTIPGSTGPTKADSTGDLQPGTKVAEILACPDETFYDYYLAKTGTHDDAIDAIKLHFAQLTNEMDIRYQSIKEEESSLDIRVHLNGVYIAQTASDSPWSLPNEVQDGENQYLDYVGALYDFSAWQRDNKDSLEQFDHAMAFTKKDLAVNTSSGWNHYILGVAWLKSVCTPSSSDYYKCSLNEDRGFRTPHVAAHELGHGMGSYHDSSYDGCANSNYFVMAAYVGTPPSDKKTNPWHFSNCSASAIKSHLNNYGTACLEDNDFTDTEFEDQKNLPLAGEQYSLTEICQWRYGLSSTPCYQPSTICYTGFKCTISGGSCSGWAYTMSGSPCGTGDVEQWCQQGECVDKPQTTTTERPTTVTTTRTTTTTTTTTSLPQTTQSPVTTQTPVTTQAPETTTECQCPVTTTSPPPVTIQKVCFERRCCNDKWCCTESWGTNTTCCIEKQGECCKYVQVECSDEVEEALGTLAGSVVTQFELCTEKRQCHGFHCCSVVWGSQTACCLKGQETCYENIQTSCDGSPSQRRFSYVKINDQ